MSDDHPPDDHDPDDRADGATDRTASSDDAPASVSDAASDRQEADGGYSEKRVPPEQREGERNREREPGTESGSESEPETGDPEPTESTSGGLSDRVAFWISALIGLVLAVGSVALVSGRAPFFEDVLRIRPTVEGGGIGADWLAGNTEPALEWLITLVHFADVVMGIFILLMVFIHWAAFRRLGARMQPPGGTRTRETATATDGGERTDGSRSSSDRSSDVGEPSETRRTAEPNDTAGDGDDTRGDRA